MADPTAPGFLNLPSLETAPRENYRAFTGALRTSMENELTAYYEFGALHMILSDIEWDALNPPDPAAVAAAIQAGNMPPGPAPRPVTNYRPVDQANQAARDDRKALNAIHVEARRVYAAARAAVLTSIGPLRRIELEDPVSQRNNLTLQQIVEQIDVWYGGLSAHDVRSLKASLTIPLNSETPEDFTAHNIKFQQSVGRLAAVAPVNAFDQLELFKATINGYPYINEAVQDYLNGTPVIAQQTLPQMAAFILTRLQNRLPTSAIAMGFAASTASTPVQSHASAEAIARAIYDVMGPLLGNHRNTSSTQAGGRRENPRLPRIHYCYFHGSNQAHKGIECTKMDPAKGALTADGNHFSKHQRNASSPTSAVAHGFPKGKE